MTPTAHIYPEFYIPFCTAESMLRNPAWWCILSSKWPSMTVKRRLRPRPPPPKAVPCHATSYTRHRTGVGGCASVFVVGLGLGLESREGERERPRLNRPAAFSHFSSFQIIFKNCTLAFSQRLRNRRQHKRRIAETMNSSRASTRLDNGCMNSRSVL